MSRRLALITALMAVMGTSASAAPEALVLETSVALPDTGGRIDHMAVDLARKRLFVAELGNGSIDIVDIASRRVMHRISGLSEPQGIVYEPKSDQLVVASGGDGTVRFYSGQDYAPRAVLKLGDDADNMRLDPRNGRLVAGYGDGALAVIDPQRAQKLRDIPMPGHPESFRFSGAQVFVNVPDAGKIVAADLDSGKVTASWSPGKLAANFPMILDDAGHIAVVFRRPAMLGLFDAATGHPVAVTETCHDADDLFFDAKRDRFYVSCGEGVIDVFKAGSTPARLARIATVSGARTSLFVPELDRLFVAERAGLMGSNASLAIYRPAP